MQNAYTSGMTTKLMQTRVKPATARWIEKQSKAEGISVAAWLRRHLDGLATASDPDPRLELERLQRTIDALHRAVDKSLRRTEAAHTSSREPVPVPVS